MPPAIERRPVLIKRYARSRLYDPASLMYRTLDELRHWADDGVRFVVIESETGEDITETLLS
jgi:polyhydroxyalkanoate synthesis regulator protein